MRIKATEASRKFSALLNRVASGETVEVDRHGEIVAVVTPPVGTLVPGDSLLDILGQLPQFDDGFAIDIERLSWVAASGADPWPS
ncbi:MAG: type II toxin-antitoxin system prevent-host-death family antitoxin [Candidatus Dormibacteraeota bacterium]|nr:type II toxin-antitoxin system prevent-host-death family antitoxin [Candidatus Dormibacteraeota bacterium]